ncbi:MAG: hypothetical protein PHI97_30030 [Desulfobulbus sp.]|nr:hypothetical protein [Desulfobulbus sp.]
MKRFIREGSTVAVLLFTVGLLLFNWPLISVPAERDGFQVLLYLFLSWIAIILCIGLYSRNEAASLSETRREGDKQ